MTWRIFTPVVLIVSLISGCASDLGEHMKRSMEKNVRQKSLHRTDWTAAERVFVLESPTFFRAHAVDSDSRLAGAAIGGAAGAAAAAGALSGIPGVGPLAGNLMLLLIPRAGKGSDNEFGDTVKSHLGQDYSVEFSQKIEQAITSRARGQVVMLTELPEQRQEINLKSTDSIIQTHLRLNFLGDKPRMLAILDWYVVVQGDRYQEIAQKMEAVGRELSAGGFWGSQDRLKKWESIQDLYDGHGQLFYMSDHHSCQEWLADRGELIRAEWHEAADQLAKQLLHSLAGGKPS
jgi:hypothetical protein